MSLCAHKLPVSFFALLLNPVFLTSALNSCIFYSEEFKKERLRRSTTAGAQIDGSARGSSVYTPFSSGTGQTNQHNLTHFFVYNPTSAFVSWVAINTLFRFHDLFSYINIFLLLTLSSFAADAEQRSAAERGLDDRLGAIERILQELVKAQVRHTEMLAKLVEDSRGGRVN